MYKRKGIIFGIGKYPIQQIRIEKELEKEKVIANKKLKHGYVREILELKK